MRPIVSVIMPTYNRAHLLPKAIDSVLNQTYPEIELIVVDDGSTDNTEEALEPYRGKITYIKKTNGGCGDAKNAGLKVAKGKYITHLDDDDLMMPERIERLAQFFAENPNIGLCATSAELIDENDEVIGIKHLRKIPPKTRLLHLLMSNTGVLSNMMFPAKVIDEVGVYVRHWCEDYDMWFKIARRYEIGIIEQPLVKYRKHSKQMTSPVYHKPHMDCLKRMNYDYIMLTPMEELIPDLQNILMGHAIRCALLCRHKLFEEGAREIRKAPNDGTVQLWSAMLVLYLYRFDEARNYFQQVPPSHPCYEEIPQALSLIDKAEHICDQYTAKDNNSEEVIQLRRELQLFNLRLFNETLKIATGGKTCLKD